MAEGASKRPVKPDGWRDGGGRRDRKLKTVADDRMERENR